jgi:hypothetical protein
VDCTQISGNVNICDAGAVLPMSTIVKQDGARPSGTLEFYTDAHELYESGPVEVSIDDAGALVLAGTTSSVGAEQPGQTEVSGWNTTLTDGGDEMAGRFVKHRRFRNFFGWQESIENCVVTLTRSRTQS